MCRDLWGGWWGGRSAGSARNHPSVCLLAATHTQTHTHTCTVCLLRNPARTNTHTSTHTRTHAETHATHARFSVLMAKKWTRGGLSGFITQTAHVHTHKHRHPHIHTNKHSYIHTVKMIASRPTRAPVRVHTCV